jgi:hypothetical protein
MAAALLLATAASAAKSPQVILPPRAADTGSDGSFGYDANLESGSYDSASKPEPSSYYVDDFPSSDGGVLATEWGGEGEWGGDGHGGAARPSVAEDPAPGGAPEGGGAVTVASLPTHGYYPPQQPDGGAVYYNGAGAAVGDGQGGVLETAANPTETAANPIDAEVLPAAPEAAEGGVAAASVDEGFGFDTMDMTTYDPVKAAADAAEGMDAAATTYNPDTGAADDAGAMDVTTYSPEVAAAGVGDAGAAAAPLDSAALGSVNPNPAGEEAPAGGPDAGAAPSDEGSSSSAAADAAGGGAAGEDAASAGAPSVTQAGCACVDGWRDADGGQHAGCANPNQDPSVRGSCSVGIHCVMLLVLFAVVTDDLACTVLNQRIDRALYRSTPPPVICRAPGASSTRASAGVTTPLSPTAPATRCSMTTAATCGVGFSMGRWVVVVGGLNEQG